MKNRIPKAFFPAALILLCLIAAFLFWYTTPYGLGLTNDSAAYLGGARSLSAGLGYTRISGDKLPRLITHFPPVYSLLISGLSQVADVDVFKSAWIINFFCYVLNLPLFAGLLRLLTGRNAAAIAAALCYLCCGPVLQTHIYALSEGVFLTFFLLSLILITRNSRDEKGRAEWFFTGLLIGTLTLVRFIGAATFLTAILFIFYIFHRNKRRNSALLATTIGACVPLSFWFLRNQLAGENSVNRVLSWHWPAADKIREGFLNLSGFFLPEFGGLVEKLLPFWAGLCLLCLLAGSIWLFSVFLRRFRKGEKPASSALILIMLQAIVYFLSVVFVVICIDGSTLFDNRIFMPLYISLTALSLTAAAFLSGENRRVRIGLAGLVLLFAAFLFEDEFDLIRDYHRDGQGFAGQVWRESETRLAAETLPDETMLFSNRQTFLWLMNDQPAYILPPMFNAANQEERKSFEAEKTWMKQEVLNGKAYVIIFNYQEMISNAEDRAWLDLLLDELPVYGIYADGAIFGDPEGTA